MTITVNGEPAVAGCVIGSHWGQYAVDHLAGEAEAFGLTIEPIDDPRVLRRFADEFDTAGYGDTGPAHLLWEWHSEACDQLIDALNAVTEGALWWWSEGDVRLDADVCDECGRDCTDDDNETEPCEYCRDAYDF